MLTEEEPTHKAAHEMGQDSGDKTEGSCIKDLVKLPAKTLV